MAVVGIIYAASSGIIRRYVVTDEPWTLPDHVGAGEAVIYGAPEALLTTGGAGTVVPDSAAGIELVASKIGFTPELGRCVVIDDSTAEVVNVIMGDPGIDAIAGHTLFQDALGSVGSLPDEAGNFQAPVAE